MPTKKRSLLSQFGAAGLALATSIAFAGNSMPARATKPQASSKPSNTAEKFTGTWHWMFNGRSFATMVLVRDGSGFTGTVTPSQIALNDNGTLRQADASDSPAKRVAKAKLEGSTLHITVEDGFEFTVSLKDDTHAEIKPDGAPANMKPIPAEKVH